MTPPANASSGEIKPPPHWGNLPGYGEVLKPGQVPPYEEDLGGGHDPQGRD